MGTKGSQSALHNMAMGVTGFVLLFSLLTPSVFAEVSASIPVTSDSATCQCGVFLLGTGTLTFSADAKPVLAGLPVAANCSASDDKVSCMTICRQLIQAMSGNKENTPLVQTVVLAATRTLACQRFNESHRVPAPRNFEGAGRHAQTLAQLDERKQWKFFVGQSNVGARSDLAAEKSGSTTGGNEMEEADSGHELSEPKWLGGYYRWCDEHWIYAGVSLHEPLCCQGHVPKRCPNYHPEESSTQKSARNGRKPRLIVIKRCPNNECEDEDEEDLEASSGENSNKVTPTTLTRPSFDDGEDETEAPDTGDKEEENEDDQTLKEAENDDSSSELINPYTTPAPTPSKPLNATVMSEALKFFETLVTGLGYGEIFDGISSVLPKPAAVQLLERINHGGWLTNYQERYIKWPREFSLGYCYLEYSMYNVKNEGGLGPAANNLLERVFGTERPMSQVRHQQPHQPLQAVPPSQNPYDTGMAPELTNYIQPMPPMPQNTFGAYEQYEHNRIPGNRRVRRGVSVSRSYSVSPETRLAGRSNSSGSVRRRNTVRRVKPQSRTVQVPTEQANQAPQARQVVPSASVHAPVTNTQYVPMQTVQLQSENDGSTARKQTSFVATQPETSSTQDRYAQVFPKVYRNNVPYTATPESHQNVQNRRSHLETPSNHKSVAEIARPRRHPGAEESLDDRHSTTGSLRGPIGHPPPQQPQRKQGPTGKDGPSAGNLINLASMIMQTAMSSGGGNDGDKVTNLMQNALPLVAQVASNQAVHSMVNNLVTTFLTPPNNNGPPPPPPQRPQAPDNDDNWGQSSPPKRPSSMKPPVRESDEMNSNEIDEPEITPSSANKPQNSRPPPPNGGGATDMIASMVQNMLKTYMMHLFSPSPGRPKPGSGIKPGSSNNNPNDRIESDKPSNGPQKESNDLVDLIANAAKPFFISTFGVVPGDPGYGRLLNRRRDEFSASSRYTDSQQGHNPNDILTEDPDPGTGLVDILVGPPNFPETGNRIYDLGNRVVYGFTNANDPHHGVYCFKQYFVNKVWDYFRVGIRAFVKK